METYNFKKRKCTLALWLMKNNNCDLNAHLLALNEHRFGKVNEELFKMLDAIAEIGFIISKKPIFSLI